MKTRRKWRGGGYEGGVQVRSLFLMLHCHHKHYIIICIHSYQFMDNKMSLRFKTCSGFILVMSNVFRGSILHDAKLVLFKGYDIHGHQLRLFSLSVTENVEHVSVDFPLGTWLSG